MPREREKKDCMASADFARVSQRPSKGECDDAVVVSTRRIRMSSRARSNSAHEQRQRRDEREEGPWRAARGVRRLSFSPGPPSERERVRAREFCVYE